MKKSVSSRIKITKNGKLVRRTTGIGHFRTRKSNKNIQMKRKTLGLNVSTQTLRVY